jgi:hypothetical protein
VKKISGSSRQVPELIRDMTPFETHGNFHATEEPYGPASYGHLRGYDYEVWRKHRQYIRYVVWSYWTPIAWWSPAYGWHVVRQTFSVTTSKHQGRLYLIDGPGSEVSRWEPFFDASLRDDLVCRRERGQHVGPVGYTDDGTLCQRHYEMRPAVKRQLARVVDSMVDGSYWKEEVPS